MLERLAHYNILDRIGAGGMGELYRARDTRHGRTVALRVLPASIRDDDERRRRFIADAARAAALSHPNLAALYETGEDRGELYAAFEFVPGESLRRLIASGPMNPRRALQVAAQIADALAEGHAHGLAHGALTADCVRLTPKGAAKVLDFGLTAWKSSVEDRGAAGAEIDCAADVLALRQLLRDMLRGPSSRGAEDVPPELEAILNPTRAAADDGTDSPAILAAGLRAADAAIAAHAESVGRGRGGPAPPSASSMRPAALVAFVAAAAVTVWLLRSC